MKKNIAVYSNDKKNPRQNLTITGQVERLFQLSPRRVRLVGPMGIDLKQIVTLVTEEKYPMNLVEVRAKNGLNIEYQLAEIREGKKNRYELTVANRRKDAGRYVDTIYLKTDSEIRPEIEIPVFGYIQNLDKKSEKSAESQGKVSSRE